MILYRISGDALQRFLEHVIVARDGIVAAAPVDSQGRFLDDGTYSDDREVQGNPDQSRDVGREFDRQPALRCRLGRERRR